jgi:phosphatidylserine/phosphatidylglycerophosphate/cardiolipin synthase-like enzyme
MRVVVAALVAMLLANAAGADADEFCEAAGTDCRARLLAYINREMVRLDIGMEEMTDAVIADAVIARFRGRVPVRLIVEPRRNSVEPANAVILNKLKAAGLPMRYKRAGDIVHWKMMIFAGQNTVQFSAAQYTRAYLIPVQPYVNFTQDPLFFSTNTSIVHSFERKFDDAWVDTANFANYANAASVARAYPFYPIDPSLNFVPAQNFGARSKPRYDGEASGIDVIMYKITEATHADSLIRAARRGVRVRLIVEPNRYRNIANVWQSYFVDRLYAAGVSIRNRAHLGFTHQKTTLLYSQRLAIFGSSNWTTASNGTQYEHNYFSTDPVFFEWFRKVFVRKWNSTTETKPFVPLPPDKPVYVSPPNTAGGQPTTIVLSWKPGLWAHRADIYLGTAAAPPLFMKDVVISPNTTRKITITGLQPGRSYFWKVVSKTMAGKTATGPVWSFGTS